MLNEKKNVFAYFKVSSFFCWSFDIIFLSVLCLQICKSIDGKSTSVIICFFSSNCFSHYRVRHRNNYSQKSAPLAAPFFCLNKNLLKKMISSPISRVFCLLSFSSFFFSCCFSYSPLFSGCLTTNITILIRVFHAFHVRFHLCIFRSCSSISYHHTRRQIVNFSSNLQTAHIRNFIPGYSTQINCFT